MEHPKVSDKRGNRIIFLSHCILNQNAKVRGIAEYPGAIVPLVELLLEARRWHVPDALPGDDLPGQHALGAGEGPIQQPHVPAALPAIWPQEIVDQVENYRQCGYQVLGFVMMDGSPVCGLNRTPRPKDPDVMWGGMAWYVPESEYVPGKGNFCEVLQEELASAGPGRHSLCRLPGIR